MSSGAMITLGLVAWFLVVLAILAFVFRNVLRGIPRKPLAQVSISPDTPFELCFAPTQAQRLRVFLRYHTTSTKTGGSVSQGVSGLTGFVCSVKIQVSGTTVVEEVIGRGSALPREVDRAATVAYFTRKTWIGSSLTEKATIPLGGVEEVPAAAEMKVTGTVELNDATTAVQLTVFVSR